MNRSLPERIASLSNTRFWLERQVIDCLQLVTSLAALRLKRSGLLQIKPFPFPKFLLLPLGVIREDQGVGDWRACG